MAKKKKKKNSLFENSFMEKYGKFILIIIGFLLFLFLLKLIIVSTDYMKQRSLENSLLDYLYSKYKIKPEVIERNFSKERSCISTNGGEMCVKTGTIYTYRLSLKYQDKEFLAIYKDLDAWGDIDLGIDYDYDDLKFNDGSVFYDTYQMKEQTEE